MTSLDETIWGIEYRLNYPDSIPTKDFCDSMREDIRILLKLLREERDGRERDKELRRRAKGTY
jgi:hypothetical protein